MWTTDKRRDSGRLSRDGRTSNAGVVQLDFLQTSPTTGSSTFLGASARSTRAASEEADATCWPWYDGEYRIHCTTLEQFKKIKRWKGCRPGSTYVLIDRTTEYDVTVPERCLSRAMALIKRCHDVDDYANPRLNPNKLRKGSSS